MAQDFKTKFGKTNKELFLIRAPLRLFFPHRPLVLQLVNELSTLGTRANMLLLLKL